MSSKVANNKFTIKTDKPNVEVSWQVTGVRNDPYTQSHRATAEQDKSDDNKGRYIHPESYGQPDSKGLTSATELEKNHQRMQQEAPLATNP